MSELRTTRLVSAAPEAIRVSVLGGRTQLDVALPADVPVAAFLPELARLITSREPRRDEEVADRDERRSFWVLSRIEGGAELAPEETLRAAGIANGEVLRISQQRALSPPTLYDDVVDAAARLNRASYAAWDATAAGVMAVAGLWSCTAVWMYFLVADALSAYRGVVVGGAVLTVVTMVGGAALAHRVLGRTDVAVAAGLPVVALSGTLGWVLTKGAGQFGLAAACGVLVVLAALYHRAIGTGRWAYVAGAVVFAFGACAFLARAWGVPLDTLAAAVATTATLGCVAVPVLTARLGRAPGPTTRRGGHHRDRPLDNAFFHTDGDDTGAAMPSAEEVWARVRSAALIRAGLLVGLGIVVAAASAALIHADSSWAAFIFAMVCVSVLALRSRRAATVPERAALALPAAALVVISCAQVQTAAGSLRLGGIVALVVIAVAATLTGLTAGRRLHRWVPTVAAYADYVAVAALVPVALWPIGVYDRLGL